MAKYRVDLAASAAKELGRLSTNLLDRMVASLEQLSLTPRPPGCKKLKGGDRQWRIRVGDYRVIYEIDDPAKTVLVTRIAHRREAYQ